MNIFYDAWQNVYLVDGQPFGTLAEIKAAFPVEYTAKFGESTEIPKYRISTVLDAVASESSGLARNKEN
jgi:hypothetical protein